jgi:hypothetical protein
MMEMENISWMCYVVIEEVSVKKQNEYPVSTTIVYRQVDDSVIGFSMTGYHFDDFNVGDEVELHVTDRSDGVVSITKIVNGKHVVIPEGVHKDDLGINRE